MLQDISTENESFQFQVFYREKMLNISLIVFFVSEKKIPKCNMRGLFDSYADLSGVACLSYVSVITEETFLKSYGVLDA